MFIPKSLAILATRMVCGVSDVHCLVGLGERGVMLMQTVAKTLGREHAPLVKPHPGPLGRPSDLVLSSPPASYDAFMFKCLCVMPKIAYGPNGVWIVFHYTHMHVFAVWLIAELEAIPTGADIVVHDPIPAV